MSETDRIFTISGNGGNSTSIKCTRHVVSIRVKLSFQPYSRHHHRALRIALCIFGSPFRALIDRPVL